MISKSASKQLKANYSSMFNMSHNSSSRLTNHHSSPPSTISTSHSTVEDFREIIREQSFVNPNGSSSDHDRVDVPIRKYPPLPDIPIPNTNSMINPLFRTKPALPKQRKQMFYHFAPSQRNHLPAIDKHSISSTISNVMDLDEDLPQCNTTIGHRAATYTSPGNRITSPIKRPSAPSPPTSAQIKRSGQQAYAYNQDDEENFSGLDADDDDDDNTSQFFNEHFNNFNYQPKIMIHRPIPHFNKSNYHLNLNNKRNSVLIDNKYIHSLDQEQ